MPLYSVQFFVFLTFVFLIFHLVPLRYRTDILLVASIAFYAFFGIVYLAILIGIALFTFYIGRQMEAVKSIKCERMLVVFYIFVIVSLLCFFKYAESGVTFVNGISTYLGLPVRIDTLSVILPVGMSFYCFKALGYIIDTYRGEIKPEKNPKVFANFLMFFPQIIAGPIDRSKNLIPQLKRYARFDDSKITDGFVLLLWGLFKKLVIADRLGVAVDAVFNDPYQFLGFHSTVAIIFYTFQIYYDFSGYTDIAIGASRILGIESMQNFNRPYASRSISEFWMRWHISLSTWLRDYLYIPLGGNREGNYRRSINVLLTFFVCGIWHGNQGTFAIWGALQGIFIIVSIQKRKVYEKLPIKRFFNRIPRLHRAMQTISTFSLVGIAWVFFRAKSIPDALFIISNCSTGFGHLFQNSFHDMLRPLGMKEYDFFLLLSFLIFAEVISFLSRYNEGVSGYILGKKRITAWGFSIALLTFVLLFGFSKHSEFIYAQF